MSRERTARNCLAGTLSQAELEYVFGPVPGLPKKAHVGLSTLAMGDLNACEYAQASHLGVLFASSVFEPAELLSLLMPVPVPREPCMVGVIIDDLIVLERIASSLCGSGPASGTLADERIARADEAYARAELLSNPSKGFQNEAHAKFWGIELDGDRGMVRPARTRLWPLIAVSIRVASLGLATVGRLKTLCGSWTSIVLLRRRVLSVMILLFAAADSGDPCDIVRLSPELKSELWCLVSLGPLIAVDLRAEPASFISATDASTWGGAAVRSPVPEGIVLELCRHSLFKCSWTHLLPAGHAWLREHDLLAVDEELPDDFQFEPNLLASLLATRLECSEIWRRGFRGPEHINCKEVRAYIIEEGHIARRGARLRTLSGLDSQVALGALVKGRSASGSLNELLEGSLGAYLGCGMYPHFLCFLSELNPSDGPTRGRDPPKASGPLPDWWCSLLSGNYGDFDSWMTKVGATRAGFSFEHLARPLKSEHPFKQVEASSSRDRLARGEAPLAQGAGLDATAVLAPADDERLGFPLKQFRWKGDGPDTATRGALDLFAGTGGAGRALLKLGAPWVLPFDVVRSPDQNLLDPDLRLRIEKMIEDGRVAAVCMAPPCNSFSSAITPRIRSASFPRGLPWLKGRMRANVSEGNSHADWCIRIVSLCEQRGVSWSIENPDSSWLWRLRSSRLSRSLAGRPLLLRDSLAQAHQDSHVL